MRSQPVSATSHGGDFRPYMAPVSGGTIGAGGPGSDCDVSPSTGEVEISPRIVVGGSVVAATASMSPLLRRRYNRYGAH